MAAAKDVTIRKRQQIDSSKKAMFAFVAGAAFIAGIALVVSLFLVRQIVFHTKVLATKQDTITALDKNLRSIEALKGNVRVLETSSALNSVKTKDESNALQSILDALPAEANADALGASLQSKFVGAVSGLTLESLTMNKSDDDQAKQTTSADPHIDFTLSVSGSADALRSLLARFEKSIRVIDVLSADIQAGDGALTLTIQGRAYYEPAQKVQLETKVVKP